ncbi:MAG: VWA domain-containing protein [Planctomycetota bacterium]|jgi:uncharacterized membrane protein
MDWANPWVLVLALPASAFIWWAGRRSLHPMSPRRRRALLIVRCACVALALLALAGPALRRPTSDRATIFVMDHSRSQGAAGMRAAYARANALAAGLPRGTHVGFVSAGESTVVRTMPARSRGPLGVDESLLDNGGAQTDLASAVALARGLFPPGAARRLVLVTDGVETRGDLESAAREAAVSGIVIDAAPVAGEPRPDARVVRLVSSRSRLHEGASVTLTAEVESSLSGAGRIRLFENGIEVESRDLELAVGARRAETFRRTPEERNLYTYLVRVEGFEGDAIPENDSALALVDVRGRPTALYIEGEPGEAGYLVDAMEREGLALHVRPPEAIPETLQELAGYDAVIISDVPAPKITARALSLLRDYVELLGGGFLMIGGENSFGVGGYYRTPVEDVLPVKMKSPDVEERASVALALVLDRSGSMRGQKVEICKSAAISTAELLTSKDYLGVVAFDSAPTWIVPMTRLTSRSRVAGQISTINSGGGTCIYPAMATAREALAGVSAKVKHMIVLTDGQTSGSGYETLSAQLHSEGVTVSTVGIGSGAAVPLLQAIAAAGGGKFYFTNDPTTIPRIFTQDTMVHMGRLIREEPFKPRQVERHPMLKGWRADGAPSLLGYVKTTRKATAQVPLVTDIGDPLLAHWRFGLGKVTAFTSDCKSRWSALWITGWEGYSQFWAQVIRETAREPQGSRMDIRLEETGGRASIAVDVLEDAASYANDVEVASDVFFVPASSIGSAMKRVSGSVLEQEGPGRYRGEFLPDRPGVYLVRARAGAEMVSAGLVHNISAEAAAGRVNAPLLDKVAALTGGAVLGPSDSLPPAGTGRSRYLELAPFLLRLLLIVFLVDLAIRRWENVLGMAEWSREAAAALARRVGRK